MQVYNDSLDSKDGSKETDNRARTTSMEEEIEACLKFLAAEQAYMNDLQKGRDIFLKRLRVHIEVNHRIITKENIDALFANYETLCAAHMDLHRMMMDLRVKSPRELHAKLGQLICEFVPYFKMYIPYVANQDRRKATLKTLGVGSMLGGNSWKTFLLINERIAEDSLKHFLEAPENRLVNYIEDLSELAQSFADTDKPSARSVFLALQELDVILRQITEKVKDLKNRRDLASVKAKLFQNKNITLSTATRFVVKKGSCKIVYKDKLVKVRIVLCSDMIFVQKPAKSFGRGGGIAWALAMKGLEVVQGAEGNEIENSFHPKCRLGLKNAIAETSFHIINFHDETQSLKWMEEINKRVEAEELTERPCNPIGLMKRLRNEKSSRDEAMEYMLITDEVALERIRSHNNEFYHSNQRSSRMDLLSGYNRAHTTGAFDNKATTMDLKRSGSLGGGTMPSESSLGANRSMKRAKTAEIPRNILNSRTAPPRPVPGPQPPAIPVSRSEEIPSPSRTIQRAKTAEIPKVTSTSAPTTPKRKSKPINFLAGIQGGMKLKKVTADQKVKKKGSFLNDIRGGGVRLKSAKKRKLKPRTQEDNSLLSQVQKTLADYRNIVVESDDESDGDSDWD